jgi:MFS family permease
MTRRAVIALGIGQCVNWGVLYYAFAVLMLPVQRELGVDTWVVSGAFSLALLVTALSAPIIGQWGDQDRGPLLMQAGGIAAAATLAVWTLTSGVIMLYVVWAGLGACMAATLYEPAFVIIGRAYTDSARRLRALAAVTLFGGLASTVFLPATAILVNGMGWRGAARVLALLMLASTAITYTFALRQLPQSSRSAASRKFPLPVPREGTDGLRFAFVAMAFALASLASAAFTTNLLPALGERGVSASAAAMVGGLIGVMQLPGRALLMNGGFAGSPSVLLMVSLVLQGVGLGAVGSGSSMLVMVGGTVVLALGAGLTTLVRPYLVQTMFDSSQGGYLNGRIARQQQLARAIGPLTVAWLAGKAGYGTVFLVMAGTFALVALLSPVALSTEDPALERDRL